MRTAAAEVETGAAEAAEAAEVHCEVGDEAAEEGGEQPGGTTLSSVRQELQHRMMCSQVHQMPRKMKLWFMSRAVISLIAKQMRKSSRI